MKTLFALTLIGASYSYLLYPLLLAIVHGLKRRRETSAAREDASSATPPVTLIITAYNEAGQIRAKILNSLELDYPNLEIIVASDCSSDQTDEIALDFAYRGVTLIRAPERRGKEFTQQLAVRQSSGKILVFSDTSTRLEPDVVRRMMHYFEDPGIGAVSSEDRFEEEDGAPVGEGAYLRYEMMLRRLESSLAGLVGLSGSLFAARRSVCEAWDLVTPSDLNVALNCARAGLKAISASDVVGYYRDLKDPVREYHRKVRTVIRGMTGLARQADILIPWRYGFFAWQVFSHKIMRWAAPVFFVGLFVATGLLQEEHVVYRAFLAGQAFFYLLAALAHWRPSLRRFGIAKLAYFFCQVNLAIVHAGLCYLAGRRMTTWQPSMR